MTRFRFILPVAVLCVSPLAACDSWDHIQKPPNFSGPGTMGEIPVPVADSQAILAANVEPLPIPMQGSLWRPGSKTFFRDPRASSVGDLLTVAVNLTENAEFANQTTLSRNTANSLGVPSMFGLGAIIAHAIPSVTGATPAASVTGSDSTAGQGDIKRSETLVVNVAATVVRILPNNNLVIAGSQEILLNNELRELQLRGIVRPEDIGSGNTISSDRIAEARIAYGGRGISSDLQRPTWGQDFLNRVSPF